MNEGATMKVSRRDLLIGTSGAAAGLLLTPVPWKLLGDVSIWTQNWPWIPEPVHGPAESKHSFCTLCSSGCGIRVRLAANCPVGIAGVSTNPVTRGALCPLGFAAHQMNWHPQRIREVLHHGRASSWTEAQAAFEKACSEGPLAILDGRPGRAASSLLKTFAGKRSGSYRVVFDKESQTLEPYATWSGVSMTELGYDFENARTILSFGAPLLDGWGPPGRFTRLWSERSAGQEEPQLRLIQVEASLSRTARAAWRRVAIHGGSEAALAAGVARVLLEEHLVAMQRPMPQMSLAEAASQTCLTPDAICVLARTVVENLPVVAIAQDGNPAVAALNILLGTVAASGGIVRKAVHGAPHAAAEPKIDSVRAVLLDSSVPWEFVPQTDAEVFRFSAWDGGGNRADWLLPAPGFLEELTDLPAAPTSPVEMYAIAQNLAVPPANVKSASQFLLQIDSTLPVIEKLILTRCEEILRTRQGSVYGEKQLAVTNFGSAQKLEEELRRGAVWVGEPPRLGSFRCELKEWPTEIPVSRAADWTTAWVPPVLPPLATKLYQESNLREKPARRNA